MSFGGGGGGSNMISTSEDVLLSNPTDGQSLSYDATLQKWVNATPSASDISGVVATSSIGAANGVAGLDGNGHLAITNLPVSVPVAVTESGGVYPARPAYAGAIWWQGPDQPAAGGSISGGAGAVNGLDVWFRTVS